MRKRGYVYLIIAIALAAFIVFTSTNSGAEHSALGGRTIEWVNRVFFGGMLSEMEKSAIVGASGKLFGHFSLFLLDGLFAYLFLKETKLQKPRKTLVFFLFGLVLACIGEITQIFSEGRSPRIQDVMIDYSGYLLPYFVVMISPKRI